MRERGVGVTVESEEEADAALFRNPD